MKIKNLEGSTIKTNNVENVINLVTENLKAMIDTKMVVGEAISTGPITLIPISKLSVGFVAGGGEYDKKTEADTSLPFAGGSGAGYSVSPVGFVVINSGDVKFIKVNPSELAEKIIDAVPEVVDSINKYLKK